jgi:hypothetical protein
LSFSQAIAILFAIAELQRIGGKYLFIQRHPGIGIDQLMDAFIAEHPVVMVALQANHIV